MLSTHAKCIFGRSRSDGEARGFGCKSPPAGRHSFCSWPEKGACGSLQPKLVPGPRSLGSKCKRSPRSSRSAPRITAKSSLATLIIGGIGVWNASAHVHAMGLNLEMYLNADHATGLFVFLQPKSSFSTFFHSLRRDLQPYLFFLLRYQYLSTPFQLSYNTQTLSLFFIA